MDRYYAYLRDIVASAKLNGGPVDPSVLQRCNVSYGASKIARTLDSMGVEYIKEFTFRDCLNIRPLRFDFYLPKYNGLIEYDGEQHYREVSIWGGKKRLVEQQARDAIKNEYCRANHLPLLRIKYTQVAANFQQIIKDFFEN